MKTIEYTFPAGPTQLKLKTFKKLSTKVLENIDVLLNSLLTELNHNIPNSSARRFNDGQVGIPIFIDQEFINYVHLNIKYWLNQELEFLPFYAESEVEGSSLLDYIIIDQETKSLVKKLPVSFNSHLLKNPFILDSIEKYLIEAGVHNFYINFDNLHIAYGDIEWITEIELTDINTLTMKMNNEAVIIEPHKHIFDENAYGKFANLDRRIEPVYLIIESQDIFKSKLLSKLTPRLQFQEDFRKFSHRHKIGLTAVLEGNALLNFVPLNT